MFSDKEIYSFFVFGLIVSEKINRMNLLKKYFNFDLNTQKNHKIMTVAYAVAIIFAFVVSLSNNNDVSASVSRNDISRQLAEEAALTADISEDISESSPVYSDNSISNIRNLFEKVISESVEKIVEQEIIVQKGDSFISILGDLGLGYNESYQLSQVLKKVYNPANLRIGQKIAVTTKINSHKHELLSIENITIEPKIGLRYILTKNEKAQYVALEIKDELMDEINSASGVINGTVSTALRAQGVPAAVVNDFVKIFAYSVDFRREVRKGDRFEIVFENKITPEGKVVKSGDILYAALKLRNNKLELYRFEDANGTVSYYNEKGQAMKKFLHRKPMSYQQARISSPFGKRRHPIHKDIRIHWGVDYAAPKNSLIYAGGDGVVVAAKYNGGYGNYIKIKHNSEYSTAYGHMNKFAKGIKPGVRVKQGQLIGYVGSTGRSTGPHLHYEVIYKGRRVNPLTIKAATGENLKGNNLKKFKKVVADLKQTYTKMFAENEEKDTPTKLSQR